MPDLLPPELSPAAALGLVVLSFFTSALTAVVSVGGGITLIGVMAAFLPPAVVLPVHGVVQLGSNVGRTWVMRAHIDRVIVVLFALGAVVGVAVATRVFVALSTGTLQLVLGLFILFSVWTPRLKPSHIPLKGFFLVGMVSTFCTMFVGAVGPFVAAFMPVERLKRFGLIATAAACLSTQHTVKLVAFGYLGFAYLPWLPVIACMIASGFVGTLAGTRALRRIPETVFVVVFRVVLTVLALRLLWAAYGA